MISKTGKGVVEVSKGLFKMVSKVIKVIGSNFFFIMIFLKGGLTSINTSCE
jgi:hypothetical protein